MIGRYNLWERLGFGAVGFMTTSAEDGGVEFCGLDRRGIIGVPGQCPMASFASNDNMLALILLFCYVGVTAFADRMAGMGDGTSRYLINGCSSKMTVLPEGTGNDCSSEPDKGEDPDCHQGSEPDEVFYVVEQGSAPAPETG